jgi:hypothetical protein
MHPDLMKKALKTLDKKLQELGTKPVKLLIGGGGAFGLAHQVPLHTADIDGVPYQSAVTQAQLDPLVKATGRELEISPDWLNPYFETFLGSLPSDYGSRLVKVYDGQILTAFALGLEDLLIMKSFAGREKDMPHAKILLRKGADINFVEAHLRSLLKKKYPGAQAALDFLLEAEDEIGG